MPGAFKRSARKRPIASRCFSLALFGALCGVVLAPVHAATPAADPVSTAAPAALTEEEVIERALGNPAFEELLAGRKDDARADVTLAGRWPNPSIQYTREQLLGGTPAGEDYVTVSQQFDISGNRLLRRRAARQRVEAQEHRNHVAQADLVARVRLAYAQTLYAQERLAVLQRWRERVEQAVSATAARASAGDVSRLDEARIRQELRILNARIATSEGSRRRAWADLRAAMADEKRGDPARLAGPLLPAAAPSTDDESLAQAPGLRALDSELSAAQQDRRASRRRWLPPVQLSFGYKGIDEGAGRQTGFTAGASIALPLGNRGQAQRRQAEARTAQVRGETTLERARLEARQSELRKRHDVLTAGLNGDRVDEELPSLAELAYRGGELGVVGLLDAYRGAYEAQNATLDLALEIRIAHVELDRLHGRTAP
jgi:cobalt-zinc-cadmium efflux system outer membrane protein